MPGFFSCEIDVRCHCRARGGSRHHHACIGQSPLPGAQDASRVAVVRYQVDTDHTHVVRTVNHMGISPLSGAIAAGGGTLELDPAEPAAAKVNVTFKLADMSTPVPAFQSIC